ncbi:hypothetical protein Pfo_010979 [Paulownia fortunei]|nr:hypothetical protein Pfo_010979 [Paulownia fortunei]
MNSYFHKSYFRLTRIEMANEVAESSSLTMRSMEKGLHEFVVENYSLCKGIGINKALKSQEFLVAGHRWTICFYPQGKDVDVQKDGYVSLYISFKSESTTPVHFFFKLNLLDQSGKGNHWGSSLFKSVPPKGAPCLSSGLMCGYLRFIKRDFLEASDYIKDDCLRIRCTIGVSDSHNQDMPIVDVPKSNIGAHFGSLLESKQEADVFFRVADESFSGHRWILAARSPVFRTRFADDHQHQEIVIPDMEPRVFRAMLWFIYTGNLLEEEQETFDGHGPFIFESFLGKMLAAADQFGLKSLKKICESRILEGVCLESVARTLHLADRHGATELKAACLKFAVENQAALMHLDGYNYLSKNCPSLLSELFDNKDEPQAQVPTYTWKDILVAIREYFAAVYRPWNAIGKKRKRKEL